MKKKIDLLNGPIAGTLARLAFPIMGTSFIQMGYNLVDMIWIGRLGSGAVAAVGAAGMFMWLANGVTTVPRIGGQVAVGHKLGAGDRETAAEYAADGGVSGNFVRHYQCAFEQTVDCLFSVEQSESCVGRQSVFDDCMRSGSIFLPGPGIGRNSGSYGKYSYDISGHDHRAFD